MMNDNAENIIVAITLIFMGISTNKNGYSNFIDNDGIVSARRIVEVDIGLQKELVLFPAVIELSSPVADVTCSWEILSKSKAADNIITYAMLLVKPRSLKDYVGKGLY